MASTFQPLSSCETPVPVLNPPTDPWGALIDGTPVRQPDAKVQIEQLALGDNLTKTPEYLAANLPAYGSGAALDHFLL